jgi:hypothetical protein
MPPPIAIPRSAAQLIQHFRTTQLKSLTNHLRLYGPLPTTTPDEASIVLPNPFLARKNPKTGKWRGPRYSLRRQADLVKKAKEADELAIVPPGPKLSAMQLGMKRLQEGLCPADSAILSAAAAARVTTSDKFAATEEKLQTRLSTCESGLRERQNNLTALEHELAKSQPQHELDELAAFEKTQESSPELSKRRKAYTSLSAQILQTRSSILKASQRLEKAKDDLAICKLERDQARLWTNPFWEGDTKRKAVKGEELGIKLYAGKKRMFKGHTWEKERAKRVRRQRILMRDMKTRVERYKSYYEKRKPNPLKPSRLSKPRKLPF